MALIPVALVPAQAQLVADGATNTLSNITNTITGDLTVGTNGSFTLLVLSDNVVVTNSGNGIIGRNATAKSNEVRLTSSTARWRMGNSLLVGSNGVFSRLIVSNGALVEDLDGALGARTASGNNSALITGTGSLWSNRNSFAISSGFFTSSSSNQLVVSDGAALVSSGAASVAGFGSQIFITGTGSRWASQSEFTLGGSSNNLQVSDGAWLVTSNGTITDLTSGQPDTVLLTGVGTVWTNSQDLTMGWSSHGVVTVSNGAVFTTGGHAAVGALTGANFNTIWITDPGSRCTIGSEVYMASSANLLVASNGGFLISSNATIGTGLGGSDNSAQVIGAGSVWSNRNFLFVGGADHDNRLVVSNGAALIVGGATSLGTNAGANANSAVVTGPGSAWTNFGPLKVGDAGASNSLAVSQGARLESFVAYVGFGPSASNNQATVTGSNSFWNASANLDVGSSGKGNKFTVSSGGRMRNTSGNIGTFVSASNNLALITGPGSSWTNAGELRVGYGSSANQLIVSNAALISAQGVVVGRDATSLNNRALIDGGTLLSLNSGTGALDVRRGTNVLNAGLIDADSLILTNSQGFFEFSGGTLITRGGVISNNVPFVVGRAGPAPAIWNVRAGVSNYLLAGRLIVGSNSSFSQVFITNGAILDGKDYTFLAFNSGSNNEVQVSGPGSTLNSAFGFFVGADGNGNRMLLGNGGKAFANLGNAGTFIGRSVGTKSNAVTVADPGSRWSVNDFLYVGSGGNANQLVVSNGATVDSLIGYVGSATSASNNLAIVTGANSSWSNRSELYVGSSASGNLLVAANGGKVINGGAFVGLSSSSRSNNVLVTGPGALWNNRGDLYVAYDGTSNQLVVDSGGSVISSNAYVGDSALAGLNTALVTGAGTLWSNAYHLFVGDDGFNNQVTVSDGARLASVYTDIGNGPNSKNNLLLVTGPGSLFTNSVLMHVGNAGTGNQLVVSNAAQVLGASCNFYVGESSTNNLGLVTDPGSLWVGDAIIVGTSTGGNRLVAANGGHIVNQSGMLGYFTSSSNNYALVTGAGSAWTNLAFLQTGKQGSGNSTVVSNGGFLQSGFAQLGNDAGSSNNEGIVTGPGSFWNSTFAIEVGVSGSRNRLVVTNGGGVTVGQTNNTATSTGLIVGSAASSINNRVIVDGGAVRVFTSALSASLDVRHGTNVLNAGVIDADLLRLTNTQGFFEFNGGTLITRGAIISNGASFVVGTSGTTPAVWDVRAGQSNYVLSVDLYLGNNSSLNKLLITNGAMLSSSSFAIIGAGNVAKSNSVIIAGPGSRCFVTEAVVGSGGSYNQVIVSNGGAFNGTASLGVLPTSTNNQIVITGAGSSWTNPGQLYVGEFGGGNQLLVSAGGRVIGGTDASIGTDTGTNNMAVVTDAGSFWNFDTLSVGNKASRSQLLVTNGGLVAAASSLLMGTVNTSTNNSLLVDSGTMLVTNAPGTGLLEIRRGTTVFNSGLIAADIVRMTNVPQSSLQFNGGLLSMKSSRISSGTILRIGNGTNPATLFLAGNGVHDFSGNLFVGVSSNAVLTGNGTVTGGFTISPGGVLSPGASIGRMKRRKEKKKKK